jgi:Delta3-Delta2-enoyl-CoA isomerase
MILTHQHGAVRELQFNRPPVNALSPEFFNALRQEIESASQQGVRALVLSGSPGIFSAGLDVPLLLTLDRPAMEQAWRDFYALLRTLATSPIPIAVAITGHAPAGGTVLAMFCDWRIASEGDWKMGLSEVQVGLILPPVILSTLQRLVGFRQAERLAVGGLLISVMEAARIGLVDEVVPADQAVPRAVQWCQGLLKLPATAMSNTRAKARADLVASFAPDLASELSLVTDYWWAEETQAALRKMVEQLASRKARAQT